MKVFVSPLDWGLGHASRCIPIIRYLLEKRIEVIIGAEGSHLIFLKEHFPLLEYIDFQGYRITYSATLPVGAKVLMQLPHIVSAINKEHELLKDIIEKHKIDAVISDNRYGLWNENIPSVIITHQLNIQAPAGNKFLSKTAFNYINHFDECWIPDYEGEENLSGVLSHPIPTGINGQYIGPLSRFESSPDHNTKTKKYDLMVILSGPEPQRSKLEEIVLKQLTDLPKVKALILQGLPDNTHPLAPSLLSREGGHAVEIVPHLADVEFEEAVHCSDLILSRPGYSTLMDLHVLGHKKAIFIPTPGQTEQEYLGKLMEKKGLGIMFKQKGFSLKDALNRCASNNFKPFPTKKSTNFDLYKPVIDKWISKQLH